MSRIRTIKPEFFTSDTLAEVSRDARLLFVGLWTMADREGRLDDRPRRIKAVLFPYDTDANVETWLAELAAAGAIIRYDAGGPRIAIPSFVDHQRPHPKEPQSRIPRHGEAVEKNVLPWKETADREKPADIPSSPVGREGKGREGKESAREPRPGPAEPGPPDLFALVAAVNLARGRHGYAAVNAMALHGPATSAWLALPGIFPGDTLAEVEAAHEAWLLTGSDWERKNSMPVNSWLKAPAAGLTRGERGRPRSTQVRVRVTDPTAAADEDRGTAR